MTPTNQPRCRGLGRSGIPALLATVLLSGLLSATVPAAAAPRDPDVACRTSGDRGTFDTAPAAQALARLLGQPLANQVELVATERAGAGDRAEVCGADGQIVVAGTSAATMVSGFHAYLKETVGVGTTWNGDSLARLPRRLPAPEQPVVHETPYDHRFVNNDVMTVYTGPYWGWEEWEEHIDVLAANGYNEVLVYPGQTSVFYETFRQFGYSDEEIRDWIPQPSHQSFFFNGKAFGQTDDGTEYNGPISPELMADQLELGQKIVQRVRSLGMTPVLRGFAGYVPTEFAEKNPGTAVVEQTDRRYIDYIDPRDEMYDEVSRAFYAAQDELFGPTTMYKMDPLHEGGSQGGIPAEAFGRELQASLLEANPEAVWVILGWLGNPRASVLSGADTSKILVVDGMTDVSATRDRERDWSGTPYTYGTIWNFGGRSPLGANASTWTEQFPAMAAKPDSALSGVALMPEQNNNNPYAFALFSELAWQPEGIDMAAWTDDFAGWRYGAPDPDARAAWQTLRETAYSTPADGTHLQPPSPFTQQPTLGSQGPGSYYGTAVFDGSRYDRAAMAQSLAQLLDVSPRLQRASAYGYDLTDVARQVLSNQAGLLHPQIAAAHAEGDLAEFRRLTREWLDTMALMDRLLGTDEQFLFGPWVEQARAAGNTPEESAKLVYGAQGLITEFTAVPNTNDELHDYPNRERNGLMAYYAERWERYFESLETSMETGEAPVEIDWLAMDDEWASAEHGFLTEPRDDTYRVARDVLKFVTDRPTGLQLSTTTDGGTLAADDTVEVTATVANPNPFTDVEDVTVELAGAPGLSVERLEPVAGEDLAAGEQLTARFEVGVADPDAAASVVELTASAVWVVDDEAGEVSEDVLLLTGEGTWISDLPWHSATNGYGPVEKDRANGETAAGDGPRLSVGGNTFAKGLGVHAPSRVVYDVAGVCTRFSAVVGVDDSRSAGGSVTFAVEVDGETVAETGVVTGADPAEIVDVDLTGAQQVALVVGNGGDGATADHADWGGARFHCDGALGPQPPAAGTHHLSDLPFASSVGGWGPWERDMHNGNTAAGDGGPIVLAGTTYEKGLGSNAGAEAVFILGGACTRFESLVGIDDTMDRPDADADVTVQVWADDEMVYESDLIEAGQEPRAIDVDLTGAERLRLVVDKADADVYFDRTDWADARISCG